MGLATDPTRYLVRDFNERSARARREYTRKRRFINAVMSTERCKLKVRDYFDRLNAAGIPVHP